ncbi:MAG: hypothetical protein EXR18_06340 [Flavobacteriaceae bacterium]|nr:hypothetical protein [Flavobacteriaceae bacterium]
MKKIISLLIVIFAFSSCTQEVTFNSPSVQGTKDNYFWRAKSSSASVDVTNATIKIVALSQFETLTLSMPLPTISQSYPVSNLLGTGEISKATFSYTVNGQNLFYATGTNTDDGQIILKEYDSVNKTVSGTYRFNAHKTTNNPLGNTLVNFKQGVFYKVPVIN